MDYIQHLETKIIESTKEIQTLRAKVEVLVEALETIATESHPEIWQVEVSIKALATYDKISEVENDTKKLVGTFCSVHNADKSKCQLHNLQCAYPSCCTTNTEVGND